MEIMEIVLILLGIVVFVLSFLVPAGRKDEELAPEVSEEFVREIVGKEVEGARTQIDEIVGETINYALEKTERSMERLTNEKMLAVNEYSDTVLEEINKNHQEVVFLYDMLNDKHESLKTTASEVTRTAGEAKQAVKDAEITAKETEEKAKETEARVREAQERALQTEERARQTEERFLEAEERARQTEERFLEAEERARETEAKFLDVRKWVDEAANASLKMKEEAEAAALEEVPSAGIGEEEPEDIPEDMAEFVPITAPKVEVIYQPPQMENTQPEDMAELRGSFGMAEDYWAAVAQDWQAEDNFAGKPQEMPDEGASFAEVPEETAFIDEGEPESGRNNNEKILSLHRLGKSNMAIARELGLGVGEVKLVIDLFEEI